MKIKYYLDEGAFKPDKAYSTDAGLDLRTPIDAFLEPNGNVAIDLGVHMEIPKNYCGLLVSKSGLNVGFDLTTTGLIDSGYTGSIVAKVHNLSNNNYCFKRGDKITQLVILPIPEIELEESEDFERTKRGENGFGSSGK